MLKNTDRTLRSGMQPPALHCFGSRPYHLEMMLAEASREISTDGSYVRPGGVGCATTLVLGSRPMPGAKAAGSFRHRALTKE